LLSGTGEVLIAVTTADPNPLLVEGLSLLLHLLFGKDLNDLAQSLHGFVIACHGPPGHTFVVYLGYWVKKFFKVCVFFRFFALLPLYRDG
jgi:hypothetical protein